MPKQLAILLDCAVLGPEYVQDQRCIECALHAAMTGDGIVAADRDRCLPWKWTDIVSLQVFKRSLADPQNPGPFARVASVAPAPPPPAPTDFYGRLEAHLARLERALQDEQGPAANPADVAADFLKWDPLHPQPATYSLPAALGEIGRWPRLSRSARIIHHIQVPKAGLADTDEVVVVPEIRVNPAVTLTPKDPGTFAVAPLNGVIAWPYADPDGAVCYVLPRQAAPPAGLQYINLATHWIEVHPAGTGEYAWHGYDHTIDMPQAVADGLLLNRALDAMLTAAGRADSSLRLRLERTDTTVTPAIRPGLRWLRRAIRRALGELLLTLGTRGPDQRRPVEAALDAILAGRPDWSAANRAELTAAMGAAAAAFEDKLH
jgi:hypothetical protein